MLYIGANDIDDRTNGIGAKRILMLILAGSKLSPRINNQYQQQPFALSSNRETREWQISLKYFQMFAGNNQGVWFFAIDVLKI